MIIFPNAKINLGLNIVGKRDDGFHNIQSVFYPIALEDVVEFIPSNALQLSISGLAVAGNVDDNLIFKAYHLLKKDFQIPNLHIHLHKYIPMGAGLGGGSADAAFFLKAVNNYFNLQISRTKLLAYAAQLGSDCAFFILNKPCLASGRGEILQPINLNLHNKKIVVVHPNIHVNTAWAYSKIKPLQPNKDLQEIISLPLNEWKHFLKNDFEQPVLSQFPAIEKIKTELYNLGATYASMSGSGSAVFGIFENEIPAIKFEENYFVKISVGCNSIRK